MPANKRWYFEFLVGGVGGITVYKNGARIKSCNGPILERITSIHTPRTRKACEKVKDYLDQALEVRYIFYIIIIMYEPWLN